MKVPLPSWKARTAVLSSSRRSSGSLRWSTSWVSGNLSLAFYPSGTIKQSVLLLPSHLHCTGEDLFPATSISTSSQLHVLPWRCFYFWQIYCCVISLECMFHSGWMWQSNSDKSWRFIFFRSACQILSRERGSVSPQPKHRPWNSYCNTPWLLLRRFTESQIRDPGWDFIKLGNDLNFWWKKRHVNAC